MFQLYTHGMIGSDLLLLQQNQKHEVIHILTYLLHFDIVARPSGKSCHVSRNIVGHSQVPIQSQHPLMMNAIAEFYSHVYSQLCICTLFLDI
jgi:hypothetical protein